MITINEMKTQIDSMGLSNAIGEVDFIKKILSSLYNINQLEANDLFESFKCSQIYHNFITEKELIRLNTELINYDGTKGGKIKDFNSFFSTIVNLQTECKPHYNENALKLELNLIISDYGGLLNEMNPNDPSLFNNTVYKMALTQLRDPDDMRSIRRRFSL